MKQMNEEEKNVCLEILNEIAMNGVNLRQAELLVVLRNTLNQESFQADKEETDVIQ